MSVDDDVVVRVKMAAVTTNMVPQPHHFSRQNLDSAHDGSVSMDSSDHFDRESPNLLDQNSCSSDDTVLSVGNENPVEEAPLTFKNIESHLNAISQITNSTLDPSRKSPSSPRLSSPSSTKSFPGSPFVAYTKPEREPEFRNSASPENFFNQKLQGNNNDANGGSLKFSIDNILKADFGRRITDLINIRKCKPKKVVPEVEEAKGPVDLSKSEPEKKTEAQPMLWPAWVYCTRYSDRPSSGRFMVLNL